MKEKAKEREERRIKIREAGRKRLRKEEQIVRKMDMVFFALSFLF